MFYVPSFHTAHRWRLLPTAFTIELFEWRRNGGMGSVKGYKAEQEVAISSKGKRNRNARLTYIKWQIPYYFMGEMEFSPKDLPWYQSS